MIVFVKEEKMEIEQIQIKLSGARIVDFETNVQPNGNAGLALKLIKEDGTNDRLYIPNFYFSKVRILEATATITPNGECNVVFKMEKKEVRIDPNANLYADN